MEDVGTDKDYELNAMQAIAKVLSPLEPKARRRIMAWVNDKFEMEQLPAPRPPKSEASTGTAGDTQIQDTAPQDVARLFDRAAPRTDAEKVLVVAYWMQEINHEGGVMATRVNKVLGQLGHAVSHINEVFTRLMKQKPALVIQTRKSGKAKQARRTFMVTAEGVKTAKSMLTGQASTEE